jgi:acyl-CoA synthetase (AMP-forming)/AMP-acid ligase II
MSPLSPHVVHAFLDQVHDLCADPVAMDAHVSFDEISRRWQTLGLRPGDLVILSLPNGSGLLHHFFGVLAAGGVPALASPDLPAARLRELAGVMGARAVGRHVRAVTALELEPAAVINRVGVVCFPAAAPAARPGEVVLFTSGTSGFASGCVFTLEALLRNATRHADAIGQRTDDTVLVTLPLHFSFALVAQAFATLVRGGRLVVGGLPFHSATYMRNLATHRVTVSSLTPVLVRSLPECDAAWPDSLRVLTVGGDALAVEQVEQLLRARPGRELYLTYGLTQAGPRVATLAAHRELAHRQGSVGHPLAGTQVLLEDLGDGTGRKQLLVSSDTLMQRRLGRLEGRATDDWRSAGVLATGDIFEQDADGYLYFRGRLADWIVRRGEKICLAAVRRVAGQLPGVVGVHTHVVRQANGDTDFDLTLVTASAAGVRRTDYRAELARFLRRGELPRSIQVGTDDTRPALGYK